LRNDNYRRAKVPSLGVSFAKGKNPGLKKKEKKTAGKATILFPSRFMSEGGERQMLKPSGFCRLIFIFGFKKNPANMDREVEN